MTTERQKGGSDQVGERLEVKDNDTVIRNGNTNNTEALCLKSKTSVLRPRPRPTLNLDVGIMMSKPKEMWK